MDAGAVVASSQLPLSSSYNDSDIRNSKSGNEPNIDTSIFTLNLSETEHDNICFHLDKNNRWQEAARKMGYTEDSIKVKNFFNNFFYFPPIHSMYLYLTSIWGSISKCRILTLKSIG